MTIVPEPDLEEFNLTWAVEVWKKPYDFQVAEIQAALSICRYWHSDRANLLRRAPKESEVYRDLKHEEELLEVYITDLREALLVTMHMNKMGGM
jgi:hypothetical protein